MNERAASFSAVTADYINVVSTAADIVPTSGCGLMLGGLGFATYSSNLGPCCP